MATKIAVLGHKLYIGNLPWTIANRQLKEYFSQFGHVLMANVVFNKDTGLSKGFGFVIYANESAVTAVNNKTRHILEGNTLNINLVTADEDAE